MVLSLFSLISCESNNQMAPIFKIMQNFSVASNIVYKTVDSTELKLDVYYPVKKLGKEPWEELPTTYQPTLIYFHGGGWVEGDKTSRLTSILPYLAKNWCVVNVDYRLLQDTNLVEIVGDCMDAINWVNKNTTTYKFDLGRLYLSGESAGGHLALLAGMEDKTQHIKGIINWYGITDVEEAIKFWNDSTYTQMINSKWEGDLQEYYHSTSPVKLISRYTPPIISIHGDADINVSIEHCNAFHQALTAKNIKNKLIQIDGKKHGNFSIAEFSSIFEEIWSFYDL